MRRSATRKSAAGQSRSGRWKPSRMIAATTRPTLAVWPTAQTSPRRHASTRLARRMIGLDAADDVTQDVFIRAWTKLATFRSEAAFGTWLYRLAVNVILARRTTLGSERGRYDDSESALESAARPAAAPEMSMDLEEAMSRLPDGARQVFVLHDLEGYRHEEIAKLLGIVSGTSKSQLHHARMALRKHLE